jgi:hypothetical protein
VDEADVVSAIKQFFELHGSSRFEPIMLSKKNEASEEEQTDRMDDRIVCGWVRLLQKVVVSFLMHWLTS